MKNCVLYGVNNNYEILTFLYGSIWTLVNTTDNIDFDIVVIGHKIEPFKDRLLELYPNIKFIDFIGSNYERDFDELVKKYTGTRFSEATCFRYLMFHDDFRYTYDKIIYLDCDTEILLDIHELFNHDMKDGIIGMREEDWNFGRMVENHFYCNAGIILFDAYKSRQVQTFDDLYSKLIEQTLSLDKEYIDQDTLNYVLGQTEFNNYYVRIPEKFNRWCGISNCISHYLNKKPNLFGQIVTNKLLSKNKKIYDNVLMDMLSLRMNAKPLTFTSLGCECFTQRWLQKIDKFNKLVNIFSLTREYDKHASDVNRDDFIFNAIENWDEFKKVSIETAEHGWCDRFGDAWYSKEMNWKIYYHDGYDVPTYFDNLYKADVYLYAFRNYTKTRERILVKFIKSLNPDARIILFSDKFNSTPIRKNGIIYLNSDSKNIVHQQDNDYAKENSQLWESWFLPQNEFNAYSFLWEKMPTTSVEFDSDHWLL